MNTEPLSVSDMCQYLGDTENKMTFHLSDNSTSEIHGQIYRCNDPNNGPSEVIVWRPATNVTYSLNPGERLQLLQKGDDESFHVTLLEGRAQITRNKTPTKLTTKEEKSRGWHGVGGGGLIGLPPLVGPYGEMGIGYEGDSGRVRAFGDIFAGVGGHLVYQFRTGEDSFIGPGVGYITAGEDLRILGVGGEVSYFRNPEMVLKLILASSIDGDFALPLVGIGIRGIL